MLMQDLNEALVFISPAYYLWIIFAHFFTKKTQFQLKINLISHEPYSFKVTFMVELSDLMHIKTQIYEYNRW